MNLLGLSESKKLLVLIPTLNSGGAENVCVAILNYFIERDPNLEISVVCLKAEGASILNLNRKIKVLDLRHPSVYFSIRKIFLIVKKINPDIIVSWMGYLNAYLIFFKPLFQKNIKWYCRESSLPSQLHKYFKNGWLFNFFYKYYNRYNKIICQSQAMAEDIITNYSVNPEKIVLINNPVKSFKSIESFEKEKELLQCKYPLLFVGRLHHVKRISILIELMTYLDSSYGLTIVGEGEEKKNIEDLVYSYNLGSRVKLVGSISNPSYYYQKASCLVVSSKYEGFPNVIIEAMSFGCPVVGYNISGGGKEVLNAYGGIYLNEDVSIRDFSLVIRDVCENKSFDKEIIAKEVKEKYSIEKIGSQYHNLIFS